MEQKYLHPMIAAQIKSILKRNDIRIESFNSSSSGEYKVFDKSGKELVGFDNGWDYGQYAVSVMGRSVAYIKWRENEGDPTPEQQAVFDIFDAIKAKQKELDAAKSMSKEDMQTMKMLESYLAQSN